MKCPKCRSQNVSIQGEGVYKDGKFFDGHATGIYCSDCNKNYPVPSKPFWETVVEKA